MKTRIALVIVAVAVLAVLWSGSQVQVITNSRSGGPPPYQSEPTCRGGSNVWTHWTPCLPVRVPMPASSS